ncbi:MAG: hypothetical protein KAY32_14645 [Candidatus Eisenbacteria sp.]|nr:hypothetical protein [Candidatus Eisenbacteria bacterium]
MKHWMMGWMGILLAAVIVGGCSESTAPETGAQGQDPQAPILPPAEVMQFDLAFFGPPAVAGAQVQESEMAGEPCSQRNWFNAALRVAAIDLIVAVGIAPPATAFAAAVHTFPSYLGDLTWLWIYTWIDAEGHEMQVRLQGRILEDDDAVAWELRVNSEASAPPLDNALWFQGESPIGYGEGYWIINDISVSPTSPAVRLDFNHASDEEGELLFENIYAGDEGLGDTLRFHELGSLCTLEFYDASADEEAVIIWHEEDGGGSLECPDYNGGEPACWTAEHCDCECPEIAPS